MLNYNLSLDCMEIASNLWRVKELTTGVRKSRNVAQLQTRECQQGVFKITTVVSSLWAAVKLCKAEERNQRTL